MRTQTEMAAKRYAMRTTHTRCAYMGKEQCFECKKSDRGNCDFRTRYEAYTEGAKHRHIPPLP